MTDYDTERQVNKIFGTAVKNVGWDVADMAWDIADMAWDIAGLNTDATESDKLQRAIEVARKLGVTIGEEDE